MYEFLGKKNIIYHFLSSFIERERERKRGWQMVYYIWGKKEVDKYRMHIYIYISLHRFMQSTGNYYSIFQILYFDNFLKISTIVL